MPSTHYELPAHLLLPAPVNVTTKVVLCYDVVLQNTIVVGPIICLVLDVFM